MTVSAKTQAVLYRIWAFAEPRGWDCTVTEIAEHLNMSASHIGSILKCKAEWRNRLRVSERSVRTMHALDGMKTVDDYHPVLGAIQ